MSTRPARYPFGQCDMARPQNPHPHERLDVGAVLTHLSDVLALSGITGGTPTINAGLLASVSS
jgi:hypothetical protein